MTAGELPAMQSSAYAATAYDPQLFGNLWQDAPTSAVMQATQTLANLPIPHAPRGFAAQPNITPVKEKEVVMPRRLVQVLIADTNEAVPLATALLYRGEPIFTDLADNELFFELDIKAMLAAHNEKRVTFTAGKSKEPLPPARVRDLKMNVVTIASF